LLDLFDIWRAALKAYRAGEITKEQYQAAEAACRRAGAERRARMEAEARRAEAQ
jgi:hypothetical protein